jgi:hypothetical protein
VYKEEKFSDHAPLIVDYALTCLLDEFVLSMACWQQIAMIVLTLSYVLRLG